MHLTFKNPDIYKFTEEEIFWAAKRFRTHNEFDPMDGYANSFMNAQNLGSLLARVRVARQLSRGRIAKTLKVSYGAVLKLERAEAAGTISLRRMREYAEALDCELVYGLRPKEKKVFSETVVQAILPPALKVRAPRFSWARINVLAEKLSEVFRDPEFRREMDWCRNPPITRRGSGRLGF